MRSATLISAVVLALFASPRPLPAQTANPPHQVQSTWTIDRAPSGAELGRTVINRRFEFGFRYIDTTPTSLLFVEEVRTTVRHDREGDNGRVIVAAWGQQSPDTAYLRSLWRFEAPGSRVSLLPDYYDVVQVGCCGATDTHTYFSLASGQPVFSFTDGPIYLQGGDTGLPSSQASYLVAFLNANAAAPSPAIRAARDVVGELLFVEGDRVRARVVLTSSNDDYVGLPTPELSVVASDGRVGRDALSIASTQSASVRLTWEDGPTVDIPIHGKTFALAAAKIPLPFAARIVR